MSFITNINKYCKDNNAFVSCANQNFNRISSFNNEGIKLINKDTKYVIVGTLTPDTVNRNNGFYYMSNNKNQIQFYLIDNAIKSSLVEFKRNNDVKGIKNELLKHNIAFLDVIEEAYVPDGNYDDGKIYPLKLASDYFNSIQKYENIIFICNSKNSQYALEVICSEINKKFNIKFCSQSKRAKGGIKQREIEWKGILNNTPSKVII